MLEEGKLRTGKIVLWGFPDNLLFLAHNIIPQCHLAQWQLDDRWHLAQWQLDDRWHNGFLCGYKLNYFFIKFSYLNHASNCNVCLEIGDLR